jgi:hypothetical protein
LQGIVSGFDAFVGAWATTFAAIAALLKGAICTGVLERSRPFAWIPLFRTLRAKEMPSSLSVSAIVKPVIKSPAFGAFNTLPLE